MSKFEKVVDGRDLTVLDRDQLKTFLAAVQRHGYASANNVAFDSSTFAYEGGNLDYYTGLSYEEPEETQGSVKVYVAGGDEDDRVTRLAKMCSAVIRGKDPNDIDEEEEG